MPDPRQLPYLLELLGDDSPVVLEAVRKELARYGPRLKSELARLPRPLPAARRRTLEELLEGQHRDWLRAHWADWRQEAEDRGRLEQALSLLAEFQSGPAVHRPLPEQLDRLADEYRACGENPEPDLLARFLFRPEGLQGARANYYHPDHSNLSAVIRSRRGLPISLCCIFILVAQRLGLVVEGCSFPGHFLARYRNSDGRLVYVDGFDGGRQWNEDSLRNAFPNPAPRLRRILEKPACAEAIIARVLHNLCLAYGKIDRRADVELMTELLSMLPGR